MPFSPAVNVPAFCNRQSKMKELKRCSCRQLGFLRVWGGSCAMINKAVDGRLTLCARAIQNPLKHGTRAFCIRVGKNTFRLIFCYNEKYFALTADNQNLKLTETQCLRSPSYPKELFQCLRNYTDPYCHLTSVAEPGMYVCLKNSEFSLDKDNRCKVSIKGLESEKCCDCINCTR